MPPAFTGAVADGLRIRPVVRQLFAGDDARAARNLLSKCLDVVVVLQIHAQAIHQFAPLLYREEFLLKINRKPADFSALPRLQTTKSQCEA